jgi:hypothetical protein
VSQPAVATAGWLRACQQPDGRILDPVHREYGTYADGFAALTFGLMLARTGDPAWAEPCRRALEVARRRPRESEFDQLALLLLSNAARRDGVEDSQLARAVGSALPAASELVLYRGWRLVSNNWVGMRALNYSLRARLTGSRSDTREAGRLWERVWAWQTADGLFIDSPGGDATPVTYHAKFCAVLALAATEAERRDPRLVTALERGLEALSALVSPSGVLSPFGRSRHALFGYAAAILALRRGAHLLERPEDAAVADRLEARLTRFQCSDGHVPAVLREGEAGRVDWDVYVNNPDYNAYAAALLMLSARGPGGSSSGGVSGGRSAGQALAAPEPTGSAPAVRRIGPLLTIRHGSSFALFVTDGQPVPRGTPFFCDHRYYGIQPLWIERDGRLLFEARPYCWRGGEDRRVIVDPAADPWIPAIEIGERRYCVRRYEHLSLCQRGTRIVIEGEGTPESYRPVPRWARGVRALATQWTGRPGRVFRVDPLAGVCLRRRLEWDAEAGRLQAWTTVEGRLPPGAGFRARTHMWVAEVAPPAQRMERAESG